MNSISTFKRFNVAQLFQLFFLCNLTLSCATKEIAGDLITQTQNTKYEFEFDFSHPDKVRDQIKKIGPLNYPGNQQKLMQLLVAFTHLNNKNENSNIKLLPRSKTLINVTSFCASSGRAAPNENEIFRWVKGYPDIQLIREVTTLFNGSPSIGKSQIQELIWNLENKTYFEDYPVNLKQILIKASTTAKLALPSRVKSRITEKLMPNRLKEVSDIVEGQYHTVEDFKKRIESIKSNSILPTDYIASTLPSSTLIARTQSSGYESQTITFFNSTNKDQNLKIADYYLKPVRDDVQPIILASIMPHNDEIKKILEDAALKLLGYIGSQYPTLNSEEKALVKTKPIDAAIAFYNAMIAESNAEKLYPNSAENGKSDAFRHYVWAGLLTRDLGETTSLEFLTAHELNPKQPVIEKEMDMFNNDQGIFSARRLLEKWRFTDKEFFDTAISEIKFGNLKVLNYDDKQKRY